MRPILALPTSSASRLRRSPFAHKALATAGRPASSGSNRSGVPTPSTAARFEQGQPGSPRRRQSAGSSAPRARRLPCRALWRGRRVGPPQNWCTPRGLREGEGRAAQAGSACGPVPRCQHRRRTDGQQGGAARREEWNSSQGAGFSRGSSGRLPGCPGGCSGKQGRQAGARALAKHQRMGTLVACAPPCQVCARVACPNPPRPPPSSPSPEGRHITYGLSV